MIKRYPMPIPFGWFHVSTSEDIAVGEAKTIRYFGQDMVLFRTESGDVSCLDAYCPHMGAHLGYGIHDLAGKGGEVKGESIVCPFHAWKFDTEGAVTDVPYAKNIPPKVKDKQCIKKFETRELNNCIFVWYHPEETEPQWEPEVISQVVDEGWGDIMWHKRIIKTHMQDIGENGADPAHFAYVHGTVNVPDVGEAVFDGHARNVVLTSKMATPRGEINGRISFANFGPGQAVTTFEGICDTVLLGHITHIEEELVEVNFGFIQKKVNGEVPVGGVNKAIMDDIKQQLDEDMPIWENKVYRSLPILCDGDGPIYKFRKWYAQFYVGWSEGL